VDGPPPPTWLDQETLSRFPVRSLHTRRPSPHPGNHSVPEEQRQTGTLGGFRRQ
jgi:hypothetical protein